MLACHALEVRAVARGAVGDVDIPAERDRRLLQCRILADAVSCDPDELIVGASRERGRQAWRQRCRKCKQRRR